MGMSTPQCGTLYQGHGCKALYQGHRCRALYQGQLWTEPHSNCCHESLPVYISQLLDSILDKNTHLITTYSILTSHLMPPFQQEFCLEAVKIGYQPIKVVGSHLSQPTVLTASLALINSILKYSVSGNSFPTHSQTMMHRN